MGALKRFVAFLAVGLAAGALSRHGSSALERDAHERGRFALTPLHMTWLGWKDILVRTWREIFEDRLMSVAAAVAFYGLMALVPSLSVLISIYGLLFNTADIERQLSPMLTLMPDAVVGLVFDQARRIVSQSSQVLSINLVIGLLIAVWSANAGIKALFDALNVIYDEQEKRSFLRLHGISLLMTLSAAVLLAITLGLIAITPSVLSALPFSAALELALRLLRWPLFFLFAAGGIAVLYWVGPSRRRARFLWVVPGAVLASLLWAIVSAAFSVYVSRIGNFEITYGSLSGVIVFMTWLWLSSCVILLGAELNSELEHQIASDTTEGLPKPIGARGASMADKIGQRQVKS